MLHIILFRPEIPQNTGNIGRLCAFTGCRLHLIHPLGFKITDAALKRAGMDYWKSLDVHHHEHWEAFLKHWTEYHASQTLSSERSSPVEGPDTRPTGNLFLLTTHATQNIWQAKFADEDGIIFGNEGHGAPEFLHTHVGQRRLRIPSFERDGIPLRSLNLSTAAGIATYEALRQIKG